MHSFMIGLTAIAVTLLASLLDHSGTACEGFVFQGVLSAQFALCGILLSIWDQPIWKRYSVVLCIFAGLSLIFLLRSPLNEWLALLAAVRLIALGLVFGWLRTFRQLVFTRHPCPARLDWGQIRLGNAFAFTSMVALFLAFARFYKNYQGPTGEWFLIGTTVVLGLFAALVPLLAAVAAIGLRSPSAWLPYAVAIALFAGGLGMFGYSQTGSTLMGAKWFLNSMVEALTITFALLAFRMRGYHLATSPEYARIEQQSRLDTAG